MDTYDDSKSEAGGVSNMFAKAATGARPSRGDVVTEQPVVESGWGRGPVPADPRKIVYDKVRAVQKPRIQFGVSKVDRMDAEDAGKMTIRILSEFGIERASDERVKAFLDALLFQHTINGGSVQQPGRGVISVDGMEFDIHSVNDLLGVDMRRYYRAYADETIQVNLAVIKNYTANDPVAAEQYGWLTQVATERGLHKFPHLAHDSAEAALTLTHEERLAVQAAKRHVTASTVNSVEPVYNLHEDVVYANAGRAGG